jgi:hypothetical protein
MDRRSDHREDADGTMRATPLERELLSQFEAEFGRRNPPAPRWARTMPDGSPIPPAVPLVGPDYVAGQGLLIYAAAENLAWMSRDSTSANPRWRSFRSAKVAPLRYRHQYGDPGLQSKAQWYPDVGIAPASNGGLLCAGLFVLEWHGRSLPTSPREMLARIALTNWCKFVVAANTNADYVSDEARLSWSLPYVSLELALLRPAFVLLPHRVWAHASLQREMAAASPETAFIPAPQFNATVVNVALRRYEGRARALHDGNATTLLGCWMSRIRDVSKLNAWRYIACLEDVLPSCLPHAPSVLEATRPGS